MYAVMACMCVEYLFYVRRGAFLPFKSLFLTRLTHFTFLYNKRISHIYSDFLLPAIRCPEVQS